MAQDRPRDGVTDAPAGRQSRIKAAREVVYEDGELIDATDLGDALEAYGVTVSTDDDGTPVYEDVPPELSLSACHLAVDLREDPSEFISTPAELA